MPMGIKPPLAINSEHDYKVATMLISLLWDSPYDSLAGNILDQLADLVDEYERKQRSEHA